MPLEISTASADGRASIRIRYQREAESLSLKGLVPTSPSHCKLPFQRVYLSLPCPVELIIPFHTRVELNRFRGSCACAPST